MISAYDIKNAMESALGGILARLEKSVASSAREAAETARAMGIASQQLRRIADVLTNGVGASYGPARFALIDDIHGDATLHLSPGMSLPILSSGDRVRILSPTLEPRHSSDFLEVGFYNHTSRLVGLNMIPSVACPLDWLEWHPLRSRA